MEPRRILARFRYKGQTIYIEDVPAWVCKKCGEEYFDALVYKRLKRSRGNANESRELSRFRWPLLT